ncbi:hypothetical protein K503DRAFT_859518 [Rhizopogon vinicolor AM-OR11-026]|uniref:F-box domain-containing protein n=1 Tax=Rhizopogon vinicolor AM-OR11-026 TaxID=1314800 RepID=A0A1B7MMS2_9AGAM|nr:hypothetical protein K503DRAFT_859518 [Rhizopogon vinicolor AM-OR11-026]
MRHSARRRLQTTKLLTSLSNEIIRRILSHLDWRTLLVLKHVCNALHSIVEGSPAVQYTIELAVSGMEDGPPGGLTAASRLVLLKERNSSWEVLKWVETRIPLPGKVDIIWELCGGVFAHSNKSGSALRLHRLPSQYRNIDERSWTIPLPSDTKDFIMDPAQDLIALVEKPTLLPNDYGRSKIRVRIRLRSLTAGHAHPSAVDTVLVHDLVMGDRRLDLTLQLCGNLLGVLFVCRSGSTPELAVWNWKIGKLVLSRCSRDIATFMFLNSHLLLVGTVMNIVTEATEPRLFIVDISRPSDKKLSLSEDYVCAFAYPCFDADVTPTTISIRSDPSADWKPNPEARLPFSTARWHRLFIVTTWVQRGRRIISHDLFVPAELLLSHVTALPPGTRLMLSPPHSFVWTNYVFGTKPTEVWDFNQLAMKRVATSGVHNDNIHNVYHATLTKDKIFIDKIRTSLPYSVTKLALPPCSSEESTYTDAMCTEDNILLVAYKNPWIYGIPIDGYKSRAHLIFSRRVVTQKAKCLIESSVGSSPAAKLNNKSKRRDGTFDEGLHHMPTFHIPV